jgi:hypothetical protein
MCFNADYSGDVSFFCSLYPVQFALVTASICTLLRNRHFPPAGRSCMTHHQALPATAAKIIQAIPAVFNTALSADYFCV